MTITRRSRAPATEAVNFQKTMPTSTGIDATHADNIAATATS